ncbi:MAG: maleylpyruvate isomerase family mycothiol-dependent enzyme [Actinomycetes bacterium]
MPGLYSHQRFCDLADAEVARLAGAIRGADPATPVPTCGRWRMDDLVQHIGHIHRWAAAMVAELSPTRHSREKVDLPLPPDPATRPDWLAEARTFLIPALRAADPDARMWAWGPDKHARFWSRRMVHETAVHRADAELALGVEPRIDPAVAVDGVGEFLENLPRSRSLRGNGEQLRLAATDQPAQWTIIRDPANFTWTHGVPQPPPNGAPTVTVHASAADLYLLLWGRRPTTDPRLTMTGDPALLAHWRQHAVI